MFKQDSSFFDSLLAAVEKKDEQLCWGSSNKKVLKVTEDINAADRQRPSYTLRISNPVSNLGEMILSNSENSISGFTLNTS